MKNIKLLIKFKIHISQLIAKIVLKQQSLNQIRHSKFLSFMTKVNINHESETKSGIFQWDIFQSDAIYFLSKNIKVFQ